ncbi:MAG: stealth family protein [Clostridium sp.]|nr:stealth family protein [Bacteroides sp.]MCM1197288.1 stealth family protein [Clostridium sp.]
MTTMTETIGQTNMDIVITYVDGNDPVWKRDYEKYTNVPVMDKRFRDWGTLKYLLRGIEVNMPFIRNVYLVVSHESQVPEWADRNNLKVVLHKEIIPEECLPTFNCNPIETHLQNIDGLSEEFLYFNDDIFPVGKCQPTDFFRNGKPVIGFSWHLFTFGMYKKICRNSDRIARKASGKGCSPFFLRPQHICTPMLKSECNEIYGKMSREIISSLSTIRESRNCNQYLYLDYMFYKGLIIDSKIPKKHFSVATAGADKICAFIQNPSKALCCINDVHLSEEKFTKMRDRILEAFEERFPEKSRFEQ